MKEIDILHIISGDLWAGAEVQVFHTLSHLKEETSLRFAALLFSGGFLHKRLKEANVPTIIIDESKRSFLGMLTTLSRVMGELKPRILHVHAYKEHILGQISAKLNHNSVSIFRTFHGMSEVPGNLSPVKRFKSTAIHRIEKIFLNSPSVNLIAVSKDLESFLKQSYPRATVTQIYNAIPVHNITEDPREQVRKLYGLKDDTFWVGSVARLAEPKNLGLLIDAGKQLKSSGLNFRISIWGEGPLKEKLQSRIDSNNMQSAIRLEGFEGNILSIMKSIDLFVLCSLHEGLPISLLEAMAVGVPVISTEVGGIREVITDGYSGLLVPSNDVTALINAIKTMLDDKDLGKRLAENARIKVQDDFDIKKTNQKLIRFYQSRLGSP